MPRNTPFPQDHEPGPREPTSSARDQHRAAEDVRVLEGVLERGRDGASAEWLVAALHEVDQAWLRWRRAVGDASRLD